MRLLAIPFAISLLIACAEDVGKDKAVATVEEPPADPTPTAPVAAEVKTLPVDASKSSIDALGAKVTAQHPIKFGTFTGSVGLAGEALAAVAFEVDVATLVSDDEKLTGHLKDKDFLDVATFPKATFTSTEVKAGSDQAGFTHTVSGDLTIRGQTKRVTFPARIQLSPTEVAASSEFVINRQDFGVTYPGRADDLVQDNVGLKISLIAPRS